jgi:hypothetical protein
MTIYSSTVYAMSRLRKELKREGVLQPLIVSLYGKAE